MTRCSLPAKRALRKNRCDTMSSACKSSKTNIKLKKVWHNTLCLQSVHSGKTGVARYPLSAKALRGNRCGTTSSVCKSSQGKQVWHDILCLQKLSGETGVARHPLSAKALRGNRCGTTSSVCKSSQGKHVWHDILCLQKLSGETRVARHPLSAKALR